MRNEFKEKLLAKVLSNLKCFFFFLSFMLKTITKYIMNDWFSFFLHKKNVMHFATIFFTDTIKYVFVEQHFTEIIVCNVKDGIMNGSLIASNYSYKCWGLSPKAIVHLDQVIVVHSGQLFLAKELRSINIFFSDLPLGEPDS